MRYALETSAGVELFTGGTPFPDGAIHPIPNWDDIKFIEPKYLKVVNENQIVEKTQEEKDAWDAAHPPTLEELQSIEVIRHHINYSTEWLPVFETNNGITYGTVSILERR
ncbi:MAG: hypothetical protein DRJ03_01265 [Chloroflexi bacterium]|nr:MAG: hypothetical protein DRJ03_01265 [Chloroflexota bacterium]